MLAVLTHPVPELPFLLIEKSARPEHVLRQTDLPVIEYRRGAELSNAKASIPTQFIFFNSRNVSSRTAASWTGQANAYHMTTLQSKRFPEMDNLYIPVCNQFSRSRKGI